MTGSDQSTGAPLPSTVSAHVFSLYGLIVGLSSVMPSLKRMYAFMWLSAM